MHLAVGGDKYFIHGFFHISPCQSIDQVIKQQFNEKINMF